MASADVEVTSPKQGDKFSGSSGEVSFKVSWNDDSDSGSDQFSLKNVQSYTILLCSGTSESQYGCDQTNTILYRKPVTGNSFNAQVDASKYGSGYYFVQVYCVFKDGSTSFHYSDRFQLTNMEGPSTVLTFTGAVPAPGTSNVNGGSTSYDSKSFTVPYTLQTGSYRFAPMQTQPGSKVTATTWSMRYPTSASSVYSTKGPKPVVYSTITPGWDYTPTSLPNWATVAPYPTYYYPASERVSKATLSGATKRKRWLD
ncbi:cell wall synthesis protein KRE9 precursor [Scheffersomyces xylosifermentans]|uniref:cell wall synthesis protein KRE9 precursor n=1 Tax=Scheffersomyces xylosifermentans TaxID=1304137 RepID=UPI00315E00B3